MPQSSRISTRDGHESRHRHSHQEGGSRRHRDNRSRSPDGGPQRHSGERRRRASPRRRDREREPRMPRSSDGHHGSSSRASKQTSQVAVALPYGARQLSKDDLGAFEALFGEYLSLQKQRYVEDMDDREIRGRWKSFVGKWNRGELAEGWYDPDMFQRILERDPLPKRQPEQQYSPRDAPREREVGHLDSAGSEDEDEDEDEDYGPVLPGASASSRRAGVGIPTKDDLALRDELAAESREADRDELRAARKADRKLQKQRLEELVPRAEAGTRQRKLEKRQEVNEKMREFREKSPGAEVRDSDLMGGGDSLEDYKKAKEKEQRRKSEREIRREEMERARREEIAEKRRAWQEREDETVSMLRELARQRFGP